MMETSYVPFIEKVAPYRKLIDKLSKRGFTVMEIADALLEHGFVWNTTWAFDEDTQEEFDRRERERISGLLRYHLFKDMRTPGERERLAVLDKQIKATMAKAATFGKPRGRVVDMGGVRDRLITWTVRDQAREIRTFALGYSYAPYQVEKEPEQ